MDKPLIADQGDSDNTILQFSDDFDGDVIPRVLLSAHRWPFLTIKHIHQITGWGPQHITRKAAPDLVHGRMLIKRKTAATHYWRGRHPNLYSLGEDGYQELCHRLSMVWPNEHDPATVLGEFHGTGAKVELNSGFRHKEAAIAALIAAEEASRLLETAQTRHIISEYNKWGGITNPTSFSLQGLANIKPDFALVMQSGEESWPLFVEVDLKASISTNSPGSVRNKLPRYWELLRLGSVQARYQTTRDGFQVLIATSEEKRAEKIRNLISETPLDPINGLDANRVFRVGLLGDLQTNFFGPHWTKPDGAHVPILKECADVEG